MANRKLTSENLITIQKELAGFENSYARSACVKELAREFGVDPATIYDASANIRPKRNTRSDKGLRKANLYLDPCLSYATKLVIKDGLTPQESFKRAAEKFDTIPIDINTFRRYLKSDGLWTPPVVEKKVKPIKSNPVVIVLDPDVGAVFKTSESVNNALREILLKHSE